MHGHGRVAQDRLGAGGRDDDRPVWIGIRLAGRLVDQVVADEPQGPGLGRGDDLEVADARLAARAPVDERLGPVGEAVAVQALERDAHGLGRPLVHRVAQPPPVGRRADPPLLGEHHGPGRLGEGDHPLEIPLATERLAALALLGEDGIEDELGGDARVVEPRQEQRGVAAHPGVADHQVLDRRPLRMPQVEGARHVGRRLDDRERRQLRVGGRARAVGREHVRGEPALVDRAFHVARGIGLGQIRHRFEANRFRPSPDLACR